MGIIWQLTIRKYTQKSLIIRIFKTWKVLDRRNPKSKLMRVKLINNLEMVNKIQKFKLNV